MGASRTDALTFLSLLLSRMAIDSARAAANSDRSRSKYFATITIVASEGMAFPCFHPVRVERFRPISSMTIEGDLPLLLHSSINFS